MRAVRKRYALLWLLCLMDFSTTALAQQAAQEATRGGDATSRFVGRWAQSRPPRDFEGGCVVGFLAFKFESSGYFIFNNRVRGTWFVDELGNIVLRTRDGERITLYYDGTSLRPAQNTKFTRRTFQYERCGAAQPAG
jgi:hypothetical protein